ncbi:MAG: hypothetical protein B6D59_04830 [Campylobacteraceae bacterium 4484_4]|nr:MAG: hypothetical protein B6D59_04830 [Campylobacteraceae bacterium 4484_4]
MKRNSLLLLWLFIFWSVLIWSAIDPKDYPTWFLEVFPALIGFVVLAATYRRFSLTPLVYLLILIHAIILMVGGHYTYAEVPLGEWMKEWFGLARNDYDKIGHFAQGFVPFMIAREIVIRNKVFKSRGWMHFFLLCFVMALSAFYELIEWWVALLSKEAAAAFLGTQGYVWDTQSDMFFALIGGLCAWVLLTKLHDRQLREL